MAHKAAYGALFVLLFLSVIFVTVICLLGRDGTTQHESFPFWQRTIVYQVYPRSLCDSAGDGTGDLRGITSQADYLRALGVGTVWLSPVYPSPMADFGYDIADFVGIEPLFGTMADFEELRAALHDRGLKLMMDFVPNHSSDEHEWFVKSKRKEEPYTDYYIWAEPKGFNETGEPIPPNNWLSVFRGSAWTWVEERQQFYYHQFLAKQPDLNYRNERVREEMKNVLRFWLEKGVDGFRVDAITHLFEAEDLSLDEPVASPSGTDDPLDYGYLNHTLTLNQPETFSVVKEWRDVLDLYPDKAMIVEVFGEEIEEVMKYYGNDSVPLADFPFNFLLIEHLRNRSDLTGFALKDTIDMWLDNMPEGKWPNWVLGNHDYGRVGSRFGADAVDALNMLVLLLPGTPVTYNGEEIGMVNTFISWEDTQDPQGCRYGPEHYQEFSRDPERTPMQWDHSPFAGFTQGNSTWLPVNENYKEVNVQAQLQAEESHLKIYKELAALRKEESFTRGHVAYPVVTFEIFSVMRYLEGYESYLLVINTSEGEVEVDLHHHSNVELPPSAVVILRSVTDTSNSTVPGSVVKLSELILVPGEGLLLNLIEEE
ncbi:maltase A3-like isoform X1 [Penaeus chinensis]|uniref:maltase A3-like isoform X1 n=1 Tax=Penaeus chinensis TaxID=139456 RepID=UPI001FB65DB0|nr:maltase A3-like isoform X1 [Penaeus chinensis]